MSTLYTNLSSYERLVSLKNIVKLTCFTSRLHNVVGMLFRQHYIQTFLEHIRSITKCSDDILC